MKSLDKFLEDVDDLSNRVYDLYIPEKTKDRIAALIEEVAYILEEQTTLRSTEWGDSK
jgi:hypothetical protein